MGIFFPIFGAAELVQLMHKEGLGFWRLQKVISRRSL